MPKNHKMKTKPGKAAVPLLSVALVNFVVKKRFNIRIV